MQIREMLREELRMLLWGYQAFDLTPFGSFIEPHMVGGEDYTCLMGLSMDTFSDDSSNSVFILCEYWAGADEIERSHYSVFGCPLDLNGMQGDYEAIAALRVYLRENGSSGIFSDVKIKDVSIDGLWRWIEDMKAKRLTDSFVLENQKAWMGILRNGR